MSVHTKRVRVPKAIPLMNRWSFSKSGRQDADLYSVLTPGGCIGDAKLTIVAGQVQIGFQSSAASLRPDRGARDQPELAELHKINRSTVDSGVLLSPHRQRRVLGPGRHLGVI